MEEASLNILIEICKRFNEKKVKYIVVGAFASILHGVEKISKQHRPTKDYDFLIEGSPENVRSIKSALKDLFKEIDELKDDEFKEYSTVQIVDEKKGFILDLIVKMWSIDYDIAVKDAVIIEIENVPIPVLSIDNLINMKKNSSRPQDKFDVYWLNQIKIKNP
jgi:hypothetical protein